MTDEKEDMSLPEAVAELKSDIDRLTRAHSLLLSGMETLRKQIEIAQNNVAVLQTALQRGTKVPLSQSVN